MSCYPTHWFLILDYSNLHPPWKSIRTTSLCSREIRHLLHIRRCSLPKCWLQKWIKIKKLPVKSYKSLLLYGGIHNFRTQQYRFPYNPGWSLTVDLKGTPKESVNVSDTEIERSETDWVQYCVREARFEACGGAKNLQEMLCIFKDWIMKG